MKVVIPVVCVLAIPTARVVAIVVTPIVWAPSIKLYTDELIPLIVTISLSNKLCGTVLSATTFLPLIEKFKLLIVVVDVSIKFISLPKISLTDPLTTVGSLKDIVSPTLYFSPLTNAKVVVKPDFFAESTDI